MKVRGISALACAAVVCAGVVVVASIATAQEATKEAAANGAQGAAAQQQPPGEMQLPPGWTKEDMQKMAAAGMPGKMHQRLTRDAGTWHGKTSMWMSPDVSEPLQSETTSKVTPAMGGRYVKVEVSGEMPGMGPYQGEGTYGYDNVQQKFVSTWIDNHSTGIMNGTGEMSPDGKTLTWTYTFHCPIADKPVTMREVETTTGQNTKTLEMFGPDPKSGREYKVMRIELTKQ